MFDVGCEYTLNRGWIDINKYPEPTYIERVDESLPLYCPYLLCGGEKVIIKNVEEYEGRRGVLLYNLLGYESSDWVVRVDMGDSFKDITVSEGNVVPYHYNNSPEAINTCI